MEESFTALQRTHYHPKTLGSTCLEGLPFPRKNPAISTASGVSLFMAIYIGMLTPFKLAKANATFAL